jgi:hypothetical protein
MTLGTMTPDRMTLGSMTLDSMTLGSMILGRMTLGKNDTNYFRYHFSGECPFKHCSSTCHSTKCHFVECHFAESHGTSPPIAISQTANRGRKRDKIFVTSETLNNL